MSPEGGRYEVDGGLFGRLLGRLKISNRAIDLRALAMNGNEATRLRVLREPSLDQKTLEILARRGSNEVRRQVANHPCLNAETARQLGRVDDQQFQAAIKIRFGSNGVGGALRETVSGPSLGVEYVPLGPGIGGPEDTSDPQPNQAEGAQEIDSGASEPRSAIDEGDQERNEINLVDQELPVDESDLDEDAGSMGQEPWPHEVLSMEGYGDEELSGDTEEDPDTPQGAPDTSWGVEFGEAELSQEDLDLAYELIGSGADHEEGGPEEEWDPNLRDDSDIAELRLLEIFEKIPSGAAGDILLERLAGKRGAPQLRFLKKLKDDGLDAEEVFLIWHVRDSWNESRDFGRYDQVLDYETVAKLVGMFSGTPEAEEVLGVLQKLERQWKSAGDKYIARNQYIRKWVWDQGGAWKTGGRPPLDLFLGD